MDAHRARSPFKGSIQGGYGRIMANCRFKIRGIINCDCMLACEGQNVAENFRYAHRILDYIQAAQQFKEPTDLRLVDSSPAFTDRDCVGDFHAPYCGLYKLVRC